MDYQQRNAITQNGKGPLAPASIGAANIYTATFDPLRAKVMGNYGTPSDGFEQLYAPMVAAQGAHATQYDSMTTSVKAATFTPGALQKTLMTPVTLKMAPLIKTGDGLLATYNKGVPPSVPGSGVSSGGGSSTGPHGGGGGGGVGGGPNAPCTGFPGVTGDLHVLVRPICDVEDVASYSQFSIIKSGILKPPPPKWKGKG